MKKQNIVAVFLAGAMLFQVTSVAFAQNVDYSYYGDGSTDIQSFYGSGNTDIQSVYGYGNTNIESVYGSGNTNIDSAYGTGYTNLPYSYGSGNTDIQSVYGSGNTNIDSVYGSGNTNIESVYGSGNTNIDSAYGSGYTNIPTSYGYGYNDIQPSYTTTGVSSATYGVSSYSYPSYQIGINYGSTGYNYGGYGYAPTVGSYGYTYGGYTNNNNTTCPSGSSLVNGTCQINTTNCPSGSTLVNGSCQITNTSCPSGSVLVNGTCQINTSSCPSGSTLINGTCQITNTSCPSGSILVNGVCTITTVNTNYTCSNGTIVAYSSLCPVSYNYSNYNYPTYTYPSTNYSGSNYYNTQPIVRYPTVTPLPTVKFNNVVTSVVTQITNTSGRCNGIGLIANGAPSTGWFEYGETSSLGRTTATASIGNSSSAPFSNVLASLKPSTRYYCRAVMQNQYGIVKGEIVSFVTKGTVVAYVQPTKTVTSVAKKVVTQVVKKPTLVTCSDGSSFYAKSETQASMLNQGEKLVTLRIEKSEGNLSANSPVSYRITYKNATDSRLTGVVVKVLIPAEIKFNLSTVGVYDEATHILTINQDTLDAHAEGVVAISGKIAQDATIGKSIVTTAYVIYTVPNTSVQDEVTAYVVGSITPNDSVSNQDTGAKKVIGAGSERGFMPNNLVEWLALIAIIFIIFILARSIYASYQEDKENAK